MDEKFIIRPKRNIKKEDKSIIITIRLDKSLQAEFDKLASKSNHSRNELMCMALRYALDNLKFVSENWRKQDIKKENQA